MISIDNIIVNTEPYMICQKISAMFSFVHDLESYLQMEQATAMAGIYRIRN